MVHQDKPAVYALYPLGRFYDFRDNSFHYFVNPVTCQPNPKDGKVWTLQEWLDEFKIEETERMTYAWNRLIGGLTMVTHKMSQDKINGQLLDVLLAALYFSYDTNKPYIEQVEQHMATLDEMRRKLAEFNELSVKERQGDPIELTKLKVRADEIEKEIATLIDKIVSASPATMEYINERIDALDEEKKNVREQIAQMSAEMYGKRNMETISGYINDWERIDMDDKLTVVDALIDNIRVGQGDVQITWKI